MSEKPRKRTYINGRAYPLRPRRIDLPATYVGLEGAARVLSENDKGACLIASVAVNHAYRCRYPRAACRCGGQALYHAWYGR